MKSNTSWNSVATWYDKTVSADDSYQNKVILPNILRIVAPEKGKWVLDLACGQGFFSHAIAGKEARVSGVDIAEELVNIAKKHESYNEEFFVSPADDLSIFKTNSFDSVFSILAIQNIEFISKVFKEVSRVTKSGGKFIMVLNHPSFRIPDKSSWGDDAIKKSIYRRVDEYLSESRKDILMNPSDIKGKKTITFHRPLQVYSKILANNSFAILRIEEWISHKKSQGGPKKSAEDKARREIPIFMCLECVKM